MSYWLLAPETVAAITEGRKSATDLAHAAAWETTALADEQRRIDAREAPSLMRIAGTTAEIRVEGVLTKKPDFFALFFGGGNTTYASIRQALAMAATDANVKTIVLGVDSPGGTVDGLFETLDAIASLRASAGKTIRVRAENAQSAAYAIAAAAGNIEAVSRASTFGSIGTAVSYWVSPNIVELTNSESPDKRPDLTTPEGKAVVVKFLDQINDEFVRAIARGRDVTARTIIETYGRGASFTAPPALELGMIDRIASTPLRAVSNRTKAMGDETPADGRASAAAIETAEQRGVTRERDRVVGHLTLGESCGDMSIALDAIRSGVGMTVELQARYMSASMNRADRGKRQAESNQAERAVEGSGPSPAAADLGDQVVALLKGADRGFVRG